MGEPMQVISAAVGLAASALKTAKLLQRLAGARAEANTLYDRTAELRSLADRVKNVLEIRYENEHLNSADSSAPIVRDTLKSIKSSINSCKTAVDIIHRAVKPLRDESERDWIKRIKFMWSTESIQNQENLINIHLQYLGVNLQILHGFDQANMANLVRSALEYSQRLQVSATDAKAAESHAVDNAVGPAGNDDTDQESALSLEIQDTEGADILGRAFSTYLDDPEGTSLAVAVRRRDAADVEQALQAGSNLAIQDKNGWTLIHHAAYNLDRTTLEHLLSRPDRLPPGFIDAVTVDGRTALMIVAEQAYDTRSCDVADVLLANGCDVGIVQEAHKEVKRDALYIAVDQARHPECVEFTDLLVKKGRNLDTSLVLNALPEKVRRGYPDLIPKKPPERRATLVDMVKDKFS